MFWFLPTPYGVWGKVMFSQVLACSPGGWVCLFPECITGHITRMGSVWLGDGYLIRGRVNVWSRGGCLVRGVWSKGGGVVWSGVGGRPLPQMATNPPTPKEGREYCQMGGRYASYWNAFLISGNFYTHNILETLLAIVAEQVWMGNECESAIINRF